MNNAINTPIPNYSSVDSMKKQPDLKEVLDVLIGVLALLVILIAVFLVNKKDISTRTFMIYMVGSDLESKSSMGTYELNGIDPKLVDLENVNVVLIAGGSKKWGNDYIDVDETSIYQLTENGFTKVKQQQIKKPPFFERGFGLIRRSERVAPQRCPSTYKGRFLFFDFQVILLIL